MSHGIDHTVARQAARRIVPLFDRILVSRVVAPSKSIGGVLLPESSVSKLNEVLFIDLGDCLPRLPLPAIVAALLRLAIR
jgi:hypothetical protein